MAEDDDAVFSRGAESGLFGPCELEVKTKVDEETRLLFTMNARKAGFSTNAECLREFVYLMAHGQEEVDRRKNNRTKAITGLGLVKAPDESK